MKFCIYITTLLIAASATVQPAFSQEQDTKQQRISQDTKQQSAEMRNVQNREQIYGSELMTEQERNEHQEKLRNMNSEQEREAYRAQHHEEMKKRASQQGFELSDEAPGVSQRKHSGQGATHNKGSAEGGSRGGGSGGSKGK